MLAPSAALTRSLARSLRSLPRSWESELLDGYFVCVFPIFDHSGLAGNMMQVALRHERQLDRLFYIERKMNVIDRWTKGRSLVQALDNLIQTQRDTRGLQRKPSVIAFTLLSLHCTGWSIQFRGALLVLLTLPSHTCLLLILPILYPRSSSFSILDLREDEEEANSSDQRF